MPAARIIISATMPVAILMIQIVLVRPRLARRSDRVFAGKLAPRSNAHYWYVGLEIVKVVALLITGAFLLTPDHTTATARRWAMIDRPHQISVDKREARCRRSH